MHQLPELLMPKVNYVIDLFAQNYLRMELHDEFNTSDTILDLKDMFYDLTIQIIHTEERLTEAHYIPIIQYYLDNGIPYIVISNEINYIKDIFLQELIQHKAVEEILFYAKFLMIWEKIQPASI